MEFEPEKVYTALDVDESFIGAEGYFANSIIGLKDNVMDNENYRTITEIRDYAFYCKNVGYNFFYLVEPARQETVSKNSARSS